MVGVVEQGQILAGKYRVERIVGEGGFGVVVAATHLHLHRQVALKFLLPHALRERTVVERFVREARAMANIRSQHVARVIDIGSLPDGAPYIVMELLEGRDFEDLVAKEGPLSPIDAAAAALEACEALAEAHALGIVHRDLKPANLFRAVGPAGVPIVKVLDFGISKVAPVFGEDHSLTKTQMVLGSPVYASPEQLRSTKHVDHRSDIWSLGATLYHLVAGTAPFVGETLSELSIKVAMDPTPPFPRGLRIPRELETIVRRCLEKDPGARYQSIVELATALARLTHEWGEETVTSRIAKSLGLPIGRRRIEPPVARRPKAPPLSITTHRGATGEVSGAAAAPGLSRRQKIAFAVSAGLLALGATGAALLLGDGDGRGAGPAAQIGTAIAPPGAPPPAPAAARPPALEASPPGSAPETKASGTAIAPRPDPATPPEATPVRIEPTAAPAAAPGAAHKNEVAAAPRKDASMATARGASSAPSAAARPRKGYTERVREADRLAGTAGCAAAIPIYEAAIDERPSGFEAVTGIGYCQIDAKNYDNAVATFRSALALSGRYPAALVGMADALRLQGDRSGAITYYQKYLAQAPTGPKAALARQNLEALGSKVAETASGSTGAAEKTEEPADGEIESADVPPEIAPTDREPATPEPAAPGVATPVAHETAAPPPDATPRSAIDARRAPH